MLISLARTHKFKAMKYLVRSIKYFFYFAIITSLVLYALIVLGMADSNVEKNFEGGYSDFWKMGVFFAAVAAVYPKLGFMNRKLYIAPAQDIMGEAVIFLQDRGYELENHTEGMMTFRLRSPLSRLVKMCEDRITITRTLDGYYMEGLRKDVLRLASGLEYKFQKED